jgi:hypothetical protein
LLIYIIRHLTQATISNEILTEQKRAGNTLAKLMLTKFSVSGELIDALVIFLADNNHWEKT